MNKKLLLLITAFSAYQAVVLGVTTEQTLDCWNNTSDNSRSVKLFLISRRDENGEWFDTFSARVNSSDSSSNAGLEVTHTVTHCEGRRISYIQGRSFDIIAEPVFPKKLSFHPKCGKNAAILDKGRSVQKISLDDPVNSVAFTNRPLRNNEIFEVKLEKKNTKFSYSLGFGISTRSPDDIEIPATMWTTHIGRTMYHSHVYANGAVNVHSYGHNLDTLQVGDRVGVMRSEFGTIHFFVNGVDQGPAASNIPYPVYGVVDLWNNAVKATIVDASS